MLSVDGLISGLNTSEIIEEILKYERRPVTLLEEQVTLATQRKTALMEVSAKLLALQSAAQTLSRASTFGAVKVSSSAEDVLAASGSSSLAAGSYTFRVARLARAASFSSNGFDTSDATAVGAGTLWIETGDARVDRETDLSILNGGRGVDPGAIRITDRAGNSSVIDLSGAITIGDVIDAINRADGIRVSASIAGSSDGDAGRGIVLNDGSGGTGTLSVQEVGGRSTAKDLGILGAASEATLHGGRIMSLGRSLDLDALNDGTGVAVRSGYDLVIRQKNGNSFSVDLSSARTLGDVLDLVNGHGDNEGITLSIAADGSRLAVADATTGAETTRILNGVQGRAATDLGIEIDTNAAAAEGARILAGLDTVLLRSLNGGEGIAAGSISITDRTGATATIDLSAAETLQDVLDDIEGAAGISVAATVNRTGNGILLSDTSSGTGTFHVAEAGGTTAADLGILRTVADDEIDGDPLSIAYVGRATKLADLREGRGVRLGRIRITDKAGRTFAVNLNGDETIGDVIQDIEGAASAAGSDLGVDINADGNGIILTSPTGTGTFLVEDLEGGKAAADLRIAGSAAGAERSIDGAGRRAIVIDADDTLGDVKRAIDDLGLDVSVAIVNDGSRMSPYRLSVTSEVSGEAGAIVVDSTGTSISFARNAAGQDAAIFYGDTSPMVLRSSTNTFAGLLGGLTLTALSTSDRPVTISAASDGDQVVESVQAFVDAYNAVIETVRDLTSWDAETETAGLLIGDGTLRNATRSLSRSLVRSVQGLPSGWNLASNVGIRVTRTGALTLDEGLLREKLAEDADAVASIFTAGRTIEDSTRLADFNNGGGVDATDAGAEFRIHQRDGTTIDVDISGDTTIRDLLASINEAADNTGDLIASISADGRSIVLEDASGGSTTFRVTALNSSPAANQLGLNRSADVSGGGTITGDVANLTEDYGVARRLVEAIEAFVQAGEGAIAIRTESLGTRIEGLNERIGEMEERISRREEILRRQFSQLEALLAGSQNTLSQLQSSLASIASASK
ncbi:MAG: flagellar filament capping protein FliD [Planctomycetes bacterium]|nr:flagellar filament capping protein FliD [Planctomycetota bacterium]